MSELKKDNLFLKKSFSIFFILILVLMPFSQVSGVSDKSEDFSINEQGFFDRVVNSFKCAFDKDCYLFEKKLDGKSFLTGFALLGSGGGCPSQNGNFVLSQDYFKVLILNNRHAGAIVNSPSVLYGSEGIHESELNPFRDPKELEIFLTSHPMTSFGAPENLVNCMLNQPLREEVDYSSSNDYSYGSAVPAVYATNQDKRFAIGHYYNVVNRIALGQKAAIETIAFIDYFNGDSVLGGVSPADLFLPSVQEHALKYKSAPFGEPDPNQPGVDARSYLRNDYKEILDSIGLIKRDRHTMRLKMMGLDSLYRGLGSSIWNNNLAEVEYNRLRIEIEKMDLVISSIDQIYSLLEGKEFVEKYHIDYISISAGYYDVVGNTDPLIWPDKIENISVNYLNAQGQHATVLDLQEAMKAQLAISRDALMDYIDLSEVALETLHNNEAVYSSVDNALYDVLEKSPPVPRFEINTEDYTSDERLKAYFANQYYTYLPGEVEQILVARNNADSVAFQIAVAPVLVMGGYVAGPYATAAGLVRTLSAVSGASVSGTAVFGAAIMGGQIAYTYGSIAAASSICTDSFGAWDSYIGSTTRSIRIGDEEFKQRYLGPITSNDYQSCVITIVVALIDTALTVYTPPRVSRWLDSADETAEIGSSAKAAYDIDSKIKGKGVNSFVASTSYSAVKPSSHAHPIAVKNFWGDLPIPTPRKDPELVWSIRQKIKLDDVNYNSPFNINSVESWAAIPPKDPFTGKIISEGEVQVLFQQYSAEANEYLDNIFKAVQERELNPYEIALLEFLNSADASEYEILFGHTLGSNMFDSGSNRIFLKVDKDPLFNSFLHESQYGFNKHLKFTQGASNLQYERSNSFVSLVYDEFRVGVPRHSGDFEAAFKNLMNSEVYSYEVGQLVSLFPEIKKMSAEEAFVFIGDIAREITPNGKLSSWTQKSSSQIHRSITSSERKIVSDILSEVSVRFGRGPQSSIIKEGKNVIKTSELLSEEKTLLAQTVKKSYKEPFLKRLDKIRQDLSLEKIEDIPRAEVEKLIQNHRQDAALFAVGDKAEEAILNYGSEFSVLYKSGDGSFSRGVHAFESIPEEGGFVFSRDLVEDLSPYYPEQMTYVDSSGEIVVKKALEIGRLHSNSRARILQLVEEILEETAAKSEEIGEPIMMIFRSDTGHAKSYKKIAGPTGIYPTLEPLGETGFSNLDIGLGEAKNVEFSIGKEKYTVELEYYVTVIPDPRKTLEYMRSGKASKTATN